MPDDEPLEYLVTQVIADYLASSSTLDSAASCTLLYSAAPTGET